MQKFMFVPLTIREDIKVFFLPEREAQIHDNKKNHIWRCVQKKFLLSHVSKWHMNGTHSLIRARNGTSCSLSKQLNNLVFAEKYK